MEFLNYHPVLHYPGTVIKEAPALEALGFDGLVMPDHLRARLPDGGPAPTPPATGPGRGSGGNLASEVARGRLEQPGSRACGARPADRHARNLAPGRVELALGAGWFEAEHVAAGVGFPAGADRVRRLVESVSICRRSFAEGTVDHQGDHYLVQVPAGGFVAVMPRSRSWSGPRRPR